MGFSEAYRAYVVLDGMAGTPVEIGRKLLQESGGSSEYERLGSVYSKLCSAFSECFFLGNAARNLKCFAGINDRLRVEAKNEA